MKVLNSIIIGFLIMGTIGNPSEVLAKKAGSVNKKVWTKDFNLEKCKFTTVGENQYFRLIPGYRLILKKPDGSSELIITVLNETKKIGGVATRVVEEKLVSRGKVIELSRNYYAMCKNNNSVFYFGEDVNDYEGRTVSHAGSWKAFQKGNMPGLMMPGIILVGGRYYEELAPGVAMDRAKIVSNEVSFKTPMGIFKKCLLVEESTPLEPGVKEYKIFAPNIGLVKDEELVLVKYETIKDK